MNKKEGVSCITTHLHYNRTDFLDSLFFFKKSNLLLLFNILRPTSLSQFLSPPKHIMYQPSVRQPFLPIPFGQKPFSVVPPLRNIASYARWIVESDL